MSLRFCVSLVTVLAALPLEPAYAQNRGGGAPSQRGGSAPGSASPGTIGTPGPGNPGSIPGNNIPNNVPNPSTQPQQRMELPPMFITGRVMLEDGAPPPQGVVIERACMGYTHAEGYTDSQGYFSLQIGQRNNGVMQDASEDNSGFGRGMGDGMGGMGGGMGAGPMAGQSQASMNANTAFDQRFMNCDLRARLAGYRSQMVSLANRQPLDDPNIGTILLHRNTPNDEGSVVSTVSLAAPKDAKKAYQKALQAEKKHKTADAVKELRKAVQVYPHYAVAWYELGNLQAAAGDFDAAHNSFDAAAKADPKFAPPMVKLAALGMRAQKWQDVADLSSRAIALDPFDYPQVFFYSAVANYYLKNNDAAEKSARQAERLDTRHQFPQTAHLLGVLLAQRQDFNGAAEQLQTYLKLAPTASDASDVRKQLEQIEKLSAQNKQGQ